eukprot:10106276-Prorocentrum_lima.AAC.1
MTSSLVGSEMCIRDSAMGACAPTQPGAVHQGALPTALRREAALPVNSGPRRTPAFAQEGSECR